MANMDSLIEGFKSSLSNKKPTREDLNTLRDEAAQIELQQLRDYKLKTLSDSLSPFAKEIINDAATQRGISYNSALNFIFGSGSLSVASPAIDCSKFILNVLALSESKCAALQQEKTRIETAHTNTSAHNLAAADIALAEIESMSSALLDAKYGALEAV
ncbi:hypothetical protein [Escherichia coli]|uniref:hypothetical protein n=1 Tax=Escherichia coli TaxID=562 RepID=UPI001CA63A77|nr:hypothetical protein [Escherichia coli]QZY67673.1 hypothetical protein K7X33_16395 [Escherichia coli]